MTKTIKTETTLAPGELKLEFYPSGLETENQYVLLFQNFITIGKNKLIYERNFMKVQNLFAIIGGFVKIIIMSFGISLFYFVIYRRNLALVKRCFRFRVGEPSDSLSIQIDNTVTKVNNLIKPTVNKSKVKAVLKLSFCSYWFGCCRNSEERTGVVEVMVLLFKEIERRLDVEYLMRTYEEVKELKRLLLSEEQLRELDMSVEEANYL